MSPATLPAMALLAAAALTGCAEHRGHAPVSGRVTLDGKPLAGAVVAFEPVAPEGKRDAGAFGSYSPTDADGRFKLVGLKGEPGAPVGPNRVAVRKPKKPEAEDGGGEVLPARYNVNTELTFTVPPGGTEQADFALTLK